MLMAMPTLGKVLHVEEENWDEAIAALQDGSFL